MHLPPPTVRPSAATEPPALVRVVTRADVLWNRPVFRAPPLEVHPPAVEGTAFYYEAIPSFHPGR
ncbi:MAG: hypothetical protein HZA93_19535 [Verrucomicrobia bacterium]|nr:hypothetical protein [Verrucomicrobiota bacterium]